MILHHVLAKGRFLVLFICYFLSFPLFSQTSFFDQLPEDSITKVEIISDLKQLVKGKKKPAYQSAVFSFHSGPLKGTTYNIKIKARGNARRKLCKYPPIKLKFSKTELEFNKIKWVSVCRNNKEMKEKILNEYLAYKLYEKLTGYSFKVRLIQMDFKAPEAAHVSLSAYGFIIEPEQELAHRTGTKNYEPRYMNESILDRYYYPLFSVFSYLIGNTDWNIENLHNMKFLRNDSTKTVIPIPFDFDYSGFVDAPYAVPHHTVPIANVRERYNKSHCLTAEERKEVCELVCAKKSELFECIDNFTLLSKGSRAELHKYLESGFDVIENPKWAEKVFVRQCEEYPN